MKKLLLSLLALTTIVATTHPESTVDPLVKLIIKDAHSQEAAQQNAHAHGYQTHLEAVLNAVMHTQKLASLEKVRHIMNQQGDSVIITTYIRGEQQEFTADMAWTDQEKQSLKNTLINAWIGTKPSSNGLFSSKTDKQEISTNWKLLEGKNIRARLVPTGQSASSKWVNGTLVHSDCKEYACLELRTVISGDQYKDIVASLKTPTTPAQDQPKTA